ncbi:MAG: hypothetical protein QM762_08720 [Chryseolinea sp.]
MMRALAYAALMLPIIAQAQVTDAPIQCGRNASVHQDLDFGTGLGWATWLCAPPSRITRFKPWSMVIFNVRTGPAAVMDVYKSCMQGACNYDLGTKLRTANLTDPSFAAPYAQAIADIKSRWAVNVAASDGKTVCACDVRHSGGDSDAIWLCPTVSAIAGPDIQCRAK